MYDLIERLGAMDDPEDPERYVCSWCLAESDDVDGIEHIHDCRIVALLERLQEAEERQ
jgi:hypothetical protein